MLDWEKSSHLNSWMFTPEFLNECRIRANEEAKISLKKSLSAKTKTAATESTEMSAPSSDGAVKMEIDVNEEGKLQPSDSSKPSTVSPYPVQHFASGYKSRRLKNGPQANLPSNKEISDGEENQKDDSFPFLTPEEEQQLIQFYSGILPSIIGPTAQSRRLQKDPKVPATANLFFRRFFLSNSVTMYDPKCILLASAFLASKVEEGMVHVQSLEDATRNMGLGVVPVQDILDSELDLVNGLNFELMCSHPYKALIALWEDLRTFLKSDKGRKYASIDAGTEKVITITSGDLKPIYDEARRLIDDVCVSDIPLLFSSGQIGLGVMMVANEELRVSQKQKYVPKINFMGYIHHRFEGGKQYNQDKIEALRRTLEDLIPILKDMKTPGGKYGCGNYPVDTNILKGVHKKLKKCRVWGSTSGGEKDGDGKKKKKKKRKSLDGDDKSKKKQKKDE